MRIAVLGPLEVQTEDGAPLTVPGAKERLLLAVLVAGAPDVVSTDRIVESLWDGDAPATARRSLHAHVVHLRSALEPDRPHGSSGRYVVRRGTGYALAAGRDEVDATLMADLTARGRARLAAGDAAGAASVLREALALWRGEPFGDWPDAEFADTERRSLTEVRHTATTALLEARLALGEHADVVPQVERLLAQDPLQESWWRILVIALYRCGRQADALAAAQRARRVLAEELGADPGPELVAVEAAVLAHDPVLTAPAPVVPRAASHDPAPCPTRGWPPTRHPTPRCSMDDGGWCPRSWLGWSTRRCSWCPVRAGPASRPWCAPAWSLPSPPEPCLGARPGLPWSSRPAAAPSTRCGC